MYEAFDKIVGDKELAKRAIKNPSEVFIELGLEVPNQEWVNNNIYEAVPDLKKHFLATIAGTEPANPREQCDSPACLACLSGMGIAAGALIAAAIAAFPEAEELIAEIADAVGCDAEFIEELIERAVKGELSVSGVLKKICEKLGTC